jgi:hypothetical protein
MFPKFTYESLHRNIPQDFVGIGFKYTDTQKKIKFLLQELHVRAIIWSKYFITVSILQPVDGRRL